MREFTDLVKKRRKIDENSESANAIIDFGVREAIPAEQEVKGLILAKLTRSEMAVVVHTRAMAQYIPCVRERWMMARETQYHRRPFLSVGPLCLAQ